MKKRVALLLALLMLFGLLPDTVIGTDAASGIFADASLSLWVKASTGLKDGVWEDQSGKGNDMRVTGTPVYRYESDTMNGKASFLLNKSAQFETAYPSEHNGSSTIFLVFHMNQMENNKGVFSTAKPASPKAQHTFDVKTMSYGKLESYSYNAGGGMEGLDRASQAMDHSFPVGIPTSYAYRVTANSGGSAQARYYYEDAAGALQSDSFGRGNSSGQFSRHQGFVIGGMDDFTSGNYTDMEVAEALVFHRALTDEELMQVRDYLNEKYRGNGYDPFEKNEPGEKGIFDDNALNLWVKASSGLASGIWKDQSGKGNDMRVNGTPVYHSASDTMNGKASFSLNKSAYFETAYPAEHNGSSTIFMVLNIKQMENNKGVFATAKMASPKAQHTFDVKTMSYGKLESYSYNAAGGTEGLDRASQALDNSFPIGIPTSYAYRVTANSGSAAAARYYYEDANGTLQSDSFGRGNSSGQFSRHQGLIIGAVDSFTNDRYIDMEIAEALVFHRALSDEEIQEVRDYLNTKYRGDGSDPFEEPTPAPTPAPTPSPTTGPNVVPDGIFADPDLSLWVKGSTGLTDGVWKDLSGKGNDMRVTGTPVYHAASDTMNGQASFSLNQSAQFEVAYPTEYNGSSTVFMAFNLKNMENNKGLFSTAKTASPKAQHTFEMKTMSYGKLESYSYNTSGAVVGHDRASESKDHSFPTNIPTSYTYRVTANSGSGANMRYYYEDADGNMQSQPIGQGNAEGQFNRHQGFVIGGRDDFSSDNYIDMEIAEILVFHRALSDEEISEVRIYLSTKYKGDGYDPFENPEPVPVPAPTSKPTDAYGAKLTAESAVALSSGLSIGTTGGKSHITGLGQDKSFQFRSVDFAQGGYRALEAELATTVTGGSFELRLDSASGRAIGSFTVCNTDGTADAQYELQYCELDSTVTGTHDVYIVGTSGNNIANIRSLTLWKHHARGASLDFETVEAETQQLSGGASVHDRSNHDIDTNDSQAGRDGSTHTREQNAVQTASYKSYVDLSAAGQGVTFLAPIPANKLLVRYTIPRNSPDVTLSVYVNDTHQRDITLTSAYCYDTSTFYMRSFSEYGFDLSVNAGDRVKFQKDAGDTAAYYGIDLVDFEYVSPAEEKPDGYLSIADFGATPNDDKDDTQSIQNCLNAAAARKTHVWIPQGRYIQSSRLIVPAGVSVKGAGIWYAELYCDLVVEPSGPWGGYVGFTVESDSSFTDFMISGNSRKRDDRGIAFLSTRSDMGNGITLDNLWVRNTSTVMGWTGWYNSDITNCRFRGIYADAIHFGDYPHHDNTAINNHMRGCGDDGIAVILRKDYGDELGQTGHNLIARFNTISATYWGRGMSVGGGTDVVYTDNIVDGTVNAGVIITTEENGGSVTPPIIGLKFQRNSISNTANRFHGHGALFLDIFTNPVENMRFELNTIYDTGSYGIRIQGDGYGDSAGRTQFNYNDVSQGIGWDSYSNVNSLMQPVFDGNMWK